MPELYAIAVKAEGLRGLSDEPMVFKPIAHTSAQAIGSVMEYLRAHAGQTGLMMGQVQIHTEVSRKVGGYDSPMVEQQMRLIP